MKSGDGKMYYSVIVTSTECPYEPDCMPHCIDIVHAVTFVDTWLHAHAMITSMDIFASTAIGFTAYKISSQ